MKTPKPFPLLTVDLSELHFIALRFSYGLKEARENTLFVENLIPSYMTTLWTA